MQRRQAEELLSHTVYFKLPKLGLHILCFVEHWRIVRGQYQFQLNPKSGKGMVWAARSSFYVTD